MLYYFFDHLYQTFYVDKGISFFQVFNVFRYISFRAAVAAITALLISIVFGPWFIRKLYQLKIGRRSAPMSALPSPRCTRTRRVRPQWEASSSSSP